MYVYWRSETFLWTVGYYTPDGKQVPESDYESSEAAAARVHYLNGGGLDKQPHYADNQKKGE